MLESASGVNEMRDDIATVAGFKDWGCTRESWLNRVPPLVIGVSFRMVKEIWYAGAKDPNHRAVVAIKRKAAEIRARNDALAAAAQFRTIAAGLHAIDPEMHSQSIAQYLDMARQISSQVGE